MSEPIYEKDRHIGVAPCKYCGAVSDRWFVSGFACKQCFDLLHTFKGTLGDKERQLIETKKP